MYALLVALLGSLAVAHAAPVAPLAAPTKHWFIFGDSYSWTGFDHTLAQPSAANPLGNPGLPGHTICGNIPAYVYYTATTYNNSLTLAYNLAKAGATVDAKVVAGATNVTLVVQVDEFAKTYAGSSRPAPWTADNSLFSLWFGVNDIGGSYKWDVNQTALHDKILDSYFRNVQRLVDLGARNFLIINAPPTDRSPQLLEDTKPNQEKYRAGVKDLNAKLATRVSSFKASHSQVSLRMLDVHTLLTNILDAPQLYGFVDSTTYNETRSDVVWCGKYHVSPGVHNYISRGVQLALDS
ncbi:hypothetical protein AURDEDRAFT_176660 [Auricularia subglabra TFB-10046 SS5]|uniref:Carbohydrate esterase family 16 protein n=1 Tax=Auricularia subglabra (strain TFB-10046 / SS5) TaxID=717982 RepID=J0CV66_AURST|nr:hypothetical protein AURDEDRAFT_176660 [Auricularia subglabra TFB-10046 SS5]